MPDTLDANTGVTWSVSFNDPDQTYAAYYAAIERVMLAAGAQWSSLLGGSANISISISFRDNPALSFHAGTEFSEFVQIGSEGGHPIMESGAAYEVRTGIDANGGAADISIYINPRYIVGATDADAGARMFWFDPQGSGSTVPAGRRDALSTFMHEIGHALGFNAPGSDAPSGALSVYESLVVTVDGIACFSGANAQAVHGGPIPLNTLLNALYHINITTDLMYYTRPEGPAGRRPISALDLAILNDCGIPIANGSSERDVLNCVAGQTSINGQDGNDTLRGASTGDTLIGAAGNDELVGNAGDDRLFGGDGDDRLFGGAGRDRIDGGAGADLVDFQASGAGVRVDLRLTTPQNTIGAGVDTYISIETVVGSNHNDTFIAGDSAVTIDAMNGDDTLTGGAGADFLAGDNRYGGGGNDTIRGGAGNDFLIGGFGADLVDGGGGNDTAGYSYAGAVKVDLRITGAQDTFGNGLDTLVGIENLLGSAFYGDTLIGNDVDNILDGGFSDGNDVLSGRGGNDTLIGNAGADTLHGGSEADRLLGGAGNDTMTGGSGGDVFVFNTTPGAGNIDTLTDFALVDTIQLENGVFTGLGAATGGLAASKFYIGAGAHDASDRIIYTSSTGALFYDPDGQGGAAKIKIATLPTGLALTASDFVVI